MLSTEAVQPAQSASQIGRYHDRTSKQSYITSIHDPQPELFAAQFDSANPYMVSANPYMVMGTWSKSIKSSSGQLTMSGVSVYDIFRWTHDIAFPPISKFGSHVNGLSRISPDSTANRFN